MTQPALHRCRFCGNPLRARFADLGAMPLANSLLLREDLDSPETYLPLRAFVCDACFLVQLHDFVLPETIFRQYLYFSSFSATWVAHARNFVDAVTERLGLNAECFVVEVASNDGYLLQRFVELDIPCLGIEPAENVAEAARERNVPTEQLFFGKATASDIASRYTKADLLIANNVIAHVPDLNDFVGGMATLLADDGVATVEAPHFLHLLEQVQFDTIYHEHFSYISLLALENVMTRHGLEVFDVDELPTHGGSLRYYIRHVTGEAPSANVMRIRELEATAGLNRLETYDGFQERVRRIKLDLLSFLIEANKEGKTVAGYGAAAKGNTLLNYCGIDSDLVSFTVDRNPHKQGRFLPGSRIPVLDPSEILLRRPDYVLILPWNLKEEIMLEMVAIRDWGGRFVWAVPQIEVSA
jgi:SAM-dependent methyltransferase